MALAQVCIRKLVRNVSSVPGIEDGAIHFTTTGVTIIDDGPSVPVPSYLIEQHKTAVTVVVHVVAVIEEPGLSLVVSDDFTVVTRSFPTTVARYNSGIVVVHHRSTLFIGVGALQGCCATDYCTIRRVRTFAARANAAEQVVVLASLVNHSSLESASSQFHHA